MAESEKNPGDGSRHPLGKKLAKWWYNLKVRLTQDKRNDDDIISRFGKRK